MKKSKLIMLMGDGPDGGKGGRDGGGSDASSGTDSSSSIAQDIIDAVKADDADALDAALKDHYKACDMGGDQAEPDADDSGNDGNAE